MKPDDASRKWVYCFSIWPNELWGRKDIGDNHDVIPPAVFEVFKSDTMRELVFTSWDFLKFRNELESYGLTLREITRWPYCEPETIP